jgi:hypothetical protein
MTQKVDLILQCIEETWGDHFVYSDCDIVFFDKIKFSTIKKYDIAFQSDGNSNCAGFFICKSNEKTLNFWKTIKKNISKYNDDQLALHHFIDMIKYKKLNIQSFFNIGHLNGFKRWDGEIDFVFPEDIKMFHANWTVGVQRKINLLNYAIDSVKVHDLSFLKIKSKKLTQFYTFKTDNILIYEINDKNLSNPIYVKKESISEIKKDEKQKINVFYNFFKHNVEERNKEFEFCLNKLLKNKKIDKLYILCENKVNLNSCDNIALIDMNSETPTFKDFFNIINFYSKQNDINIILNSDCFIDEKNIQLIKHNIKDDEVFCLSRWDIVDIKKFKLKHYDVECSQDAWIKKGHFSEQLDGNYKMGTLGCDNSIASEFEGVGYTITNPSKELKIYHYHLSEIRSYEEKNRILKKYRFVQITDLLSRKKKNSDEVVKIRKVGKETILQIPPEMTGKELKEFKENSKNNDSHSKSTSGGGIRP